MKLWLTIFALSSMASQAATVWQAGAPGRNHPIDGVGGGPDVDFFQEAGVNPLPGNPNSPLAHRGGDDDYYFAGLYTTLVDGGNYTPVGEVLNDETGAERAFAGTDNSLRYHFNLTNVNESDLFSVSFEPISLHGQGGSEHYGVEIYVNNVLVASEIDVNPGNLRTVITSEQFTLASVNARVGSGFDNYVELRGINYNASGGGNWMGIDYTALNSAPAVPPPTINNFTASPVLVVQGQTSSLSWTVADFDILTLNPGEIDVSALTTINVTPDQTTTYTLSAENDGGTVTREVTVAYDPEDTGIIRRDCGHLSLWQAGAPGRGTPLDGVGGGPDVDFFAESGTNPLPGNPDSPLEHRKSDDDYYFAGVYTKLVDGGNYTPVGYVANDERGAERAFAGTDNSLRYHFNLPTLGVGESDLLSVSFEANSLHGQPGGTQHYGVEIYFNNVLVAPEIDVNPGNLRTIITSPKFTLASVNAEVGPGFDNYIELRGINYNGAGGGNWMGIDYTALNATSATSLADSRTDFSGVQGQGNWNYGYRNLTVDGGAQDYDAATDFVAFDAGHWTGTAWDLAAQGAPWTILGREATHPNGSNSAANGGGLHWTVRRWTAGAEVGSGKPVALCWHIRKTNLNHTGVTGALHINGVRVDSLAINGNDGVGGIRTFYANIVPGDIVDLIHSSEGPTGDQHDGNDGSANWLTVDSYIPPNPVQPDGTAFVPALPEALKITDVSVDLANGTMTLSWPSAVGRTYAVDTSTGLGPEGTVGGWGEYVDDVAGVAGVVRYVIQLGDPIPSFIWARVRDVTGNE